MYAKKVLYSGNRCRQRIWYILGMLQFIPHGELGGFVQISDLLSPDHLWNPLLRLRIQVVDVTPDMDISKQIASGETHRPVLRGKSAKDVHWYVTSACDFMVRPVTSWWHEHTMILIALSSQPKWYIENYWNRLEHMVYCKELDPWLHLKKPSTCCCVGQALSEEDLPPVKWFIRGLAKRLADLCHLITTEVPIYRVLGNIPWIFDSPVVYGNMMKHVCRYPIHFPIHGLFVLNV